MSAWLDPDLILDLIRSGWQDVAGLDLGRVVYSNTDFAIRAGAVLAGLVLLKFLFVYFDFPFSFLGLRKPTSTGSGFTYDGNLKSILAKIAGFLPKIALAVPLAVIIFAIADPFLPVIKEERQLFETRMRKELKDVSGSMASPFKDSKLPKARVAMDAHLNFLKMRKGKGDRNSLSIFSDNPYLIQNFTFDEQVYLFQAFSSPWEVGAGDRDLISWESYPNFDPNKYFTLQGEGGTSLTGAIKSVISEFDEDVRLQKRLNRYGRKTGRSLLIVTDAEISDPDSTAIQFGELIKRNIAIYIIFIDASSNSENSNSGARPLLDLVVASGGRYFPISSPTSLFEAYREIDRLEKIKVEVIKRGFRNPLFDIFVFASILALTLITLAGLSADLIFKEFP
jgi:hypothetical protein